MPVVDDVANEAKQKREELYAETRKDLLTRQLSNSEKFDGAILTLSTAAIGVSLAFVRDIVPLQDAECMAWLMASWWLFCCAIVSTLFSFVASQLGIRKQLAHAEKYYLEEQDEYLNKRNLPARATEWLNYLSGLLFVAALASTIMFVTANL